MTTGFEGGPVCMVCWLRGGGGNYGGAQQHGCARVRHQHGPAQSSTEEDERGSTKAPAHLSYPDAIGSDQITCQIVTHFGQRLSGKVRPTVVVRALQCMHIQKRLVA